MKLPSSGEVPEDPFTTHRTKVKREAVILMVQQTTMQALLSCPVPPQMLEAMQPLRPYQKLDTLRQYLDHDKQVLRFHCVWDDTDW